MLRLLINKIFFCFFTLIILITNLSAGEIKIKSNSMEMLPQKKLTIFKGDVVVTQDKKKIEIDFLTRDEQNQLISGEGNVYLTDKLDKGESIEIWADNIFYNIKEEYIKITGNPKLKYKQPLEENSYRIIETTGTYIEMFSNQKIKISENVFIKEEMPEYVNYYQAYEVELYPQEEKIILYKDVYALINIEE